MPYAHPEYLTSAETLARLVEEAARNPQSTLRIYDCSVTAARTLNGTSLISGRDAWRKNAIVGSGFMDLVDSFSDSGSALRFTLPSVHTLQAACREVGICNDSHVVLYSASHVMWATRAWWMLHSCGHKHVSVLDGGLAAWRQAGGGLAPGHQHYPRGDFDVAPDKSKWADQRQVLNAVGSDTLCTLNALPQALHSGQASSPYGRRGHIPGSLNLEYESLLDDGRFKDAHAIRSALAASGAREQSGKIIYCGAGISATLDAFALALIGEEDVRVYDGSLAEWARDPNLPMQVSAG